MKYLLASVIVVLAIPVARATETIAARDLTLDPTRFLDHQIRVDKLGCF